VGDRTRCSTPAFVVACILVLVTVLTACADGDSSSARDGTATSKPSAREGVRAVALPSGADGSMVSVTDGDTVRVRLDGGGVERVRLIGIDTPELHDPRTVVECFGAEAAAETQRLLPAGTAVRLETDVEPRDRYGRLLAYVWRADDGFFVNEALVEGGWAVPYRYPPNVRYADRFSRLGREARQANRGLWGACGNADTPAATTTTVTPPADTGGGDGCDPNYAGACIPISATDLDCSDVQARNFRVVGTDIHHFDGDHDGIACEGA
jgi:micrococcal nuclease